jgi:hypothetical protein
MANRRKFYFIAGISTCLVLVLLALVFYKERVAFSDSAFLMVYLLIEHKPFAMLIRASTCIPQFMTLSAIWCHCDLKIAMMVQSVSTQVMYLFIYFLAYKFSKKRLLFVLIPLNLILLVNEVFYWPISEVQQGLIWLCLYAVLLFEKRWDGMALWKTLIIHFLCIVWIQFLHPLLFFPIAFLVLYYYNTESQLFSAKALYHFALCIVAFAIRSILGRYNWYERDKLDIIPLVKNNLPHLFSLGSVHAFAKRIPSDYLIYILLLSAAMIWLIVHRKYLRSLILISFSVGYWVLIMIYSPADARFYTENMLLPLGFMTALAVVADMIAHLKMSYTIILIVLITGLRFGYLYHAHRDYTARFSVYDPYFDYLKKTNLKGILADDKLVDQKKIIVTWSSSFESLLISALKSPDSSRVVIFDGDTCHYSKSLYKDTVLITQIYVWNTSQLPEHYFKMPKGGYEILTKRP